MVQQITKGIKISVKSIYKGLICRGGTQYYSFSYFITIQNKSKETVQLIKRFWEVYDSLSFTEYVEGEGVVGQTPILPPKSEYSYKSNCFLTSSVGSMKGNYKMINIHTGKEFLVNIPVFQLMATSVLN